MALSNEQWNAPSGVDDFYEYQVSNSCRFNHAGYLNDARSGDGNTQHGSISFWVKRGGITSVQHVMDAREDGNNAVRIQFLADDTLEFRAETSSSVVFELETTRVFRDTSAWYHIVGIIDLNNGTQGDRVQLYINGIRETVFDVDTYPSNNSSTMTLNTSANLRWGAQSADGSNPLDGYLADVVVIDGAGGTIGDFGTFKNGVWTPVDPSGITFGTNGHYLNFATTTLGNDVSGNNHDFAATGLAAHDLLLDSPTFGSKSNGGNFCTINPNYSGTAIAANVSRRGAITEGNLKHGFVDNQDASCPCTHKTPPSGKWYFEFAIIAGGGSGDYSPSMGIIDPELYTCADSGTNTAGLIAYVNFNNRVRDQGTYVASYDGSRGSNGDVMGIAVDMDNGAFYVSKNGTYYGIDGGATGDPTSGSSQTGAGATWTTSSEFTNGMVPISQPTGGSAPVINVNFGQDGTFQGTETAGGNADANGFGNFFTAPPTDYLAVCSGNLPTPAVDPAEDDGPFNYFAPKLYTGDGANTLAITGLEFQPDWTWIKNRDAGDAHMFFDSSRGVTERLTLDTAVEATDADTLKSFTSDGFTVGADVKCNTNTEKYVSWNWKLNGGTTSSETDGGINTTCQTNTTAGISIIQYAGDGGSSDVTMEHNLGAKPEFLIMKDRDSNGNNNQWGSWHKVSGFGKYAYWSTTGAPAASTNGTVKAVSDELITFNRSSTSGGSQTRFENGDNYIIYAFTSKEGFSKFGSYEGNGNANGSFVYTGFAPALVITKSVDSTSSWHIFDNLREGYNVDNDPLIVEATTAEATTDMVDLLSNGFKFRISSDPNVAESYIFLAWASNPFKFATAR